MLHVTNGDVAAQRIERSGLPGTVLPWRDVLHDGPVPGGLSEAELRAVRARYLASRGTGPDAPAIERSIGERDAALARCGEHDEVVLWFEADLYDQLQLVQILERLGRIEQAATTTLVCIGEHSAVERFVGLGQLEPGHFPALAETRAPVGPAQLTLGRAAWEAFTGDDARRVEALLARDTAALPFLGPALRRWLEQLPSVRSGLGRTERVLLQALRDGSRSASELFHAQADQERHPFAGDQSVWGTLEALAAEPHPLLQLEPAGGPTGAARATLTADGARVLDGARDRVALCGIDLWWGGVHLEGREAAFRWDEDAARVRAA
ncbi:MAG: DUF1835 domain-containing protein [Myxococcota bacterium]|nr:DUF1835 domain-containing protein [Myxococcota bacterium]